MQRYTIDTRNVGGFGDINFDLGVGEDFACNLQQSSLYNNEYMEKIKEENINPIIDYEKHIFYPAYLNRPIDRPNSNFIITDDLTKETMVRIIPKNTGDDVYNLDLYSCEVNKIIFNLYLKKRYHDENNGYGDWESKDELYWNRWDGTVTGGVRIGDNVSSTNYYGDALGCLGFTDDDVFYQKNNLKKSFLRIAIYDSPYRQTQRLLYYSTLFFDTNSLYKKYTELNRYPKVENEQRVYQNKYKEDSGVQKTLPEDKRLTATFVCTNKFDNSACSDGFYLYLFDTIAKFGQCTPLYMKIEFNNAKYGKSIPLICPYNSVNGNTIDILENQFPEDYEKTFYTGSNNSFIDINKLYDDMYIPVFVRYNNKTHRFEWLIASNFIHKPNEIPEDVLMIDLYEPRINKLKN